MKTGLLTILTIDIDTSVLGKSFDHPPALVPPLQGPLREVPQHLEYRLFILTENRHRREEWHHGMCLWAVKISNDFANILSATRWPLGPDDRREP
jgi:hypothetical protein